MSSAQITITAPTASAASLNPNNSWRVNDYIMSGGAASTNSFGNGAMILVPYDAPVAMTPDRIGINVTGAGSASTVYRFGIYTDSDGDGLPDALALDAGTVDASTIGAKEVTALAVAVAAGPFWVAVVQQTASAGNATVTTVTSLAKVAKSTALADLASSIALLRLAGVTGALPASLAGMAYASTSSYPRVAVRRGA